MPLTFALLVVAHFVADFVLQSRTMAKEKSRDPQWLLRHGLAQMVVFLFVCVMFMTPHTALIFAVANALIHCFIDWNLWKGYKAYLAHRMFGRRVKDLTEGQQQVFQNFKYWEDYWFYTVIGFDQLLHLLTIIFLYWLLQ